MVIRRIIVSLFGTGMLVVGTGLTPLPAAQQDQKPTAFYVNAPPSVSPADSSADSKSDAARSLAVSPAEPQTPVPAVAAQPPVDGSQPRPLDDGGFETRTVKKIDPHSRPAVKPDAPRVAGALDASPMRMILALAAVLGLILVAAFVFRRLMPNGRQAARDKTVIHVLARSMIAPRQFIYLIRLGSRLLVVGAGPNHMTALDAIDDPDEIARLTGLLEQQQSHSISKGFAQLFQRQSADYDAPHRDERAAAGQDSAGDAPRQWFQAQGELHNLLDKVRSLSRLHFRSPMR